MLDDTTKKDVVAIDEVTDLLGFLDELQEEEDTTQQQFHHHITIPKISVPTVAIPIAPTIPVVTAPTQVTQVTATRLQLPQTTTTTTSAPTAPTTPRPEVLPVYSLDLTRKERVHRWQAKRARRTWNKANNEYYAIRKRTASKRRRVGGKFSGSSVSWVTA